MSAESVADVASKTVDHIANGFKAIADAAQKVAPHAWEVAVRQSYTEGVVEMVEAVAVLLVCFAILVYAWRKREWFAQEDGERAPLLIFPVFAFVFAIVASNALAEGYMYTSNPEYYAAKSLLEAVK